MSLNLDDYLYDLPEKQIAKHPPAKRGGSRLLHYNQGNISHHSFADITDLLPDGSMLVFNDTRVIPARVIMHKPTGARIEIFLLEPLMPSKVHEEVMNAKGACRWKCMIGNAKKWPEGTTLTLGELSLKATRVDKDTVSFEWNESLTFSDLLTEIGKIPLPPYIDREVEDADAERYQTVYSKSKGAVAAPTAGLHFTEEIIQKIEDRSILTDFVTLHVSAGTFQPIKSEKIEDHPMHNEQLWVTRQNVERLLQSKKIIAVGTTSMRTLESLYWYGVKLLSGHDTFFISQKDPYSFAPVPKRDALQAVLDFMTKKKLSKIGGHTEIFLYPGYSYKICEGLVTNYHLPGSTLILLIASFIGDNWRKVYDEALGENYQFLSYGDSSLLIP